MTFQKLHLVVVVLSAWFALHAVVFPAAAAEPSWPPVHSGLGEQEAKIRRQLDLSTKLQFDGARLDEAVAFLQELHGIQIVLDKGALEAINITGESLVTIDVQNVSLRSGLRLMMRSLDPTLVFVIRDEVLTITTAEAAEETIVERVYDVSLLLGKGESAQDLAASLEQAFHRRPAPARDNAGRPPGDAGGRQDPGRPDEGDAESEGPLIAGSRAALLVRGTEAQHESVIRLLRGLKELADAKAKGE